MYVSQAVMIKNGALAGYVGMVVRVSDDTVGVNLGEEYPSLAFWPDELLPLD